MPGATGGCFFASGVGPSERVVSTNWTPGRPLEGGRALGQGGCRAGFRISSSCFVASMDEYGFSCLQKLLLLFCETKPCQFGKPPVWPLKECSPQWWARSGDGWSTSHMLSVMSCRFLPLIASWPLFEIPDTRFHAITITHVVWYLILWIHEPGDWLLTVTPRSEKPCGGRLQGNTVKKFNQNPDGSDRVNLLGMAHRWPASWDG